MSSVTVELQKLGTIGSTGHCTKPKGLLCGTTEIRNNWLDYSKPKRLLLEGGYQNWGQLP
jgi:hypothetical protein